MKINYRLVLLVSPLLALYGVMPILLFSDITFLKISISYLALTIMVALFWIVNINLFNLRISKFSKYLLSYSGSLLIHLCLLLFTPILKENVNISAFIIYPLASTIAFNSIMLVMIYLDNLKKDKLRTEIELNKTRFENLEAQKKALVQQLQPHFLFNALSVLKSLITTDATKAVQYTLSLAEFLRYANQSGADDTVTVLDEINFTKEYLELQITRFEKALRYKIDVDEQLLNCTIPIFALQSLVENAIKHNAISMKMPLEIAIYNEGNSITVSNKKQPKALSIKSGTGLTNLNNRYQLMFDMPIQINESTTHFQVKIPVICH